MSHPSNRRAADGDRAADQRPMALPRQVDFSDIRRDLAGIIDQVADGGDHIVVTRQGQPVMGFVPPTDAERVVEIEDLIDITAANEAHRNIESDMSETVPWEQVVAELDQATDPDWQPVPEPVRAISAVLHHVARGDDRRNGRLDAFARISLEDAVRHLDDLVDTASSDRDWIVVTRSDEPAAVAVSLEDVEGMGHLAANVDRALVLKCLDELEHGIERTRAELADLLGLPGIARD